MLSNTEAAALVVIVRSTATGARVGSTVDVCVRQGSRSMVPPPFWKQHQRVGGSINNKAHCYHYNKYAIGD